MGKNKSKSNINKPKKSKKGSIDLVDVSTNPDQNSGPSSTTSTASFEKEFRAEYNMEKIPNYEPPQGLMIPLPDLQEDNEEDGGAGNVNDNPGQREPENAENGNRPNPPNAANVNPGQREPENADNGNRPNPPNAGNAGNVPVDEDGTIRG
ncbi:hypothetical protein WICPIJ_001716 [Wickerhamomyces pijperi]|uniref:Uncharacterized protein n=1 Tax=Wickerhamomyces pijperi TaxID=599730 RepID=A0A9P8QAE7_WICPI|nr:hypothetical protein WICPIJ_001716 [Wickerhamomyces pijperi]